MKMSPKSGAAMAATAAALLLSGGLASAPAGAADAKGHCMGANACGGKNKCKGQGFLEMTKAECDAAAASNKDEKVQITFEEAKK